MRVLLSTLAAVATRWPRVVLVCLLVATAGFGVLASGNRMEVDLTRLGSPGSAEVRAMERVREEFGDPASAVRVVLDAGPGGDVLGAEGLVAVAEAEALVLEALGSDVRTGPEGQPMVLSPAMGLGEEHPLAAQLLSEDAGAGSARGAMVVAELDPELPREEGAEAAERVAVAFEEGWSAEGSGVTAAVFGPGLFEAGMMAAMRAEAPVLFALALVVVLVGLSLFAATALETRFDRGDFVPEGSAVQEELAHQEELFGAGADESTLVLLEGDLADPGVVAAVQEAQAGLAGVEGVRTRGGGAQVRPVFDEVEGLALIQVRTAVGDAEAERLRADLESAFAPVEAAGASVSVTSEPMVMARMNADLSRFQTLSIGLTLGVVTFLTVAYYAVAHRRPLLGAVAVVPAVVGASSILGTMWVFGIAFNVVTATLTAIAIGVGVPFGVHVVNRFAEGAGSRSAGAAVEWTLANTGGALAASGLTTLGALVVLAFSGLVPIRSLGLLGGVGIGFALLAALLVVPGLLYLWAQGREGRLGVRR